MKPLIIKTPLIALILMILFIPGSFQKISAEGNSSDAQLGAKSQTSSQPTDPKLEALYSKRLEEKITQETVKVEASLQSLFNGVAATLISLVLLGLFMLYRTWKQGLELRQLQETIQNNQNKT